MFNVRQATYLVSIKSPDAVYQEIKIMMDDICPRNDLKLFLKIFDDVCDLYSGHYPRYRACNLLYHDLSHTMGVLLAMARLIHGATLCKHFFSKSNIHLALAAALLHDVGYIQTKSDRKGTGAKHTATHVNRSMEFAQKYLHGHKRPAAEIKKVQDMILCTSLTVSASRMRFKNSECALLSRMLSCADLVGQMADREYLEKLLFLYYEFKEANVGDYSDEADLLRKTVTFFSMIDKRLAQTLSDSGRFMCAHFTARWNIKRDCYAWYMRKNLTYLKTIIAHHGQEYRSYLKRGNVVQNLETLGL
jgi:hypothetical protein